MVDGPLPSVHHHNQVLPLDLGSYSTGPSPDRTPLEDAKLLHSEVRDWGLPKNAGFYIEEGKPQLLKPHMRPAHQAWIYLSTGVAFLVSPIVGGDDNRVGWWTQVSRGHQA